MAYCSASDVQVALGYQDIFDDSVPTRPTATQVDSIISNITNEIDLYLGLAGINTTPTDVKILGRLKEMCIYGSSARVGFGYLNNAEVVGGSLAHTFWERYQQLLNEIVDKPEIYGGTAGTSTMYASNQVTDGTNSEATITGLYEPSDYEV